MTSWLFVLQWGGNKALMAVTTIANVFILSEQVMTSSYMDQVRVLRDLAQHMFNLLTTAGESFRSVSCKLKHRLPETVSSLNHISHHAQHHASSNTVYQRQCLHSVLFLITPNVMQAQTLFTRQCLHSILFPAVLVT